jgi:dUTP pyrophosphatase
MHNVKFRKHSNTAVMPTRAHKDDIGYDLTAVGIYKVLSDKVVLYETGIYVQPPQGHYIEIVPRSSLSASGHMMANSIGIIDPSYTGSLKIPVIKVDENSDDLKLPFTKFQLILRKAIQYELEEVNSLEETERGSGGFGSTD